MGKIRKLKFTIILVISIIITFVVCFFMKPLISSINYGLDLQGGFEVLYEVSPIKEDEKLTSDMLYATYQSILKRIDILGVSEPVITIEGENRIRVKLAGVTNVEEARNTISSTASLSFRDYNDNLLMTSDVLGGKASVDYNEKGYVIALKIKDTDTFYETTKKVKDMDKNVMVIWLDYKEETDSYRKELLNKSNGNGGCGSNNSHCLSDPYVNQAFASNVVIEGNFTKESASKLVDLINSGALPTNLKEVSSRTVEASFGQNSLEKTMTAGVIGIIIVIILITLIYRFSGFIAGLCLILYTFLSFLVFYLINGVLTLPGIAAMLLGIGMAIDANVICFERIKENLIIGKSLKESYEIGNKSSFRSVIDANITTVIAAIIMFVFGQSSVKGFATMLIISIITTVITMIYLAKLILKLFVDTNIFDNRLGLFIGVNKKKIVKSKEINVPFDGLNFVKNKGKFFLLSIVLLAVGGVFYFTTKPNYGIDFTGGTEITFNETKDIDKVKDIILGNKYKISKINSGSETTIILDNVLEREQINNLKASFDKELKLDTDIYVVSSVVKRELVKNAIKSLVLASIGIIIYVAIRFKFNYAISGIVALIHDVLFTFLFFTVFKIQIDSVFIAAILTIIGYSINDTIVTFDLIREIYKDKYKNKIENPVYLEELVDTSIKRTLIRTIITTLTTIIPVIVLLFFGSKEIMNFNIALLVGFISGVYSSIFISNMIWLILEGKKIQKPIKEEKIDDVEEIKIKGINC